MLVYVHPTPSGHLHTGLQRLHLRHRPLLNRNLSFVIRVFGYFGRHTYIGCQCQLAFDRMLEKCFEKV